jgi:hypothetical protein
VSDPIVFAVVAEGEPSLLESTAQAVWDSLAMSSEPQERTWRVEACGGGRAAVVETMPGSEGVDQLIAQALVQRLSRPVYVLRFREDAPAAFRVFNGVQELAKSPAAVSRDLGCDFAAEPADAAAPPPAAGPACTVCVVEGASVEQVLESIRKAGLRIRPGHVEPCSAGTMLWDEKVDPAGWIYSLSELLPGPVYLVSTDPQSGAFTCQLARSGDDAGLFQSPAPAEPDPGSPVLSSVKGRRSPHEIAAALGVPPHLLCLR